MSPARRERHYSVRAFALLLFATLIPPVISFQSLRPTSAQEAPPDTNARNTEAKRRAAAGDYAGAETALTEGIAAETKRVAERNASEVQLAAAEKKAVQELGDAEKRVGLAEAAVRRIQEANAREIAAAEKLGSERVAQVRKAANEKVRPAEAALRSERARVDEATGRVQAIKTSAAKLRAVPRRDAQLASLLANRGSVRLSLNRFADADTDLNAALPLWRAVGIQTGEVRTLLLLGRVAITQAQGEAGAAKVKRLEIARFYLNAALPLARATGDAATQTDTLRLLTRAASELAVLIPDLTAPVRVEPPTGIPGVAAAWQPGDTGKVLVLVKSVRINGTAVQLLESESRDFVTSESVAEQVERRLAARGVKVLTRLDASDLLREQGLALSEMSTLETNVRLAQKLGVGRVVLVTAIVTAQKNEKTAEFSVTLQTRTVDINTGGSEPDGAQQASNSQQASLPTEAPTPSGNKSAREAYRAAVQSSFNAALSRVVSPSLIALLKKSATPDTAALDDEARKQSHAAAVAGGTRLFVVVVDGASGADVDAQNISKVFEGQAPAGYDEVVVTNLTDTGKLAARLESLGGKVSARDTIVVYYRGPITAAAGPDGPALDPNLTAGELFSLMDSCAASHRAIIVESGDPDTPAFYERLRDSGRTRAKVSAGGRRDTLLISAGGGEAKPGTLVKALVDGLGGAADVSAAGAEPRQVSARELKAYLPVRLLQLGDTREVYADLIGTDFPLTVVQGRDLRGVAPGELSDVVTADPPPLGKCYALLVATDNYASATGTAYWPGLQGNPLRDIRALKTILERRYGFQVTIVENGTKEDWLAGLDRFNAMAPGPSDQLLVYFAGHGKADTRGRGYLIPRGAPAWAEDFKTKQGYLNYGELESILSAMPFQHVALVLDACYGGRFKPAPAPTASLTPLLCAVGTAGPDLSLPWPAPQPPGARATGAYENRELGKRLRERLGPRSRVYYASGSGPVPNGDPGRLSPFAARLASALEGYKGDFLAFTTGLRDALELNNGSRGCYGEFTDNQTNGDFVFLPTDNPPGGGR